MRIDVIGKGMDLTDAISSYADQKASKLPRYFNGVQSIDVVLEPEKNERFACEIRVDVVKHDTFVAKVQGGDVYGCIDTCVDKMSRQLSDFKAKLKDTKR